MLLLCSSNDFKVKTNENLVVKFLEWHIKNLSDFPKPFFSLFQTEKQGQADCLKKLLQVAVQQKKKKKKRENVERTCSDVVQHGDTRKGPFSVFEPRQGMPSTQIFWEKKLFSLKDKRRRESENSACRRYPSPMSPKSAGCNFNLNLTANWKVFYFS